MKILNVVGRIDPVTGGGTAERTKKISIALEKAGAECTILCSDPGVTPLLVESLGGKVLECAFVIELPDLKGREKIERYPVFTLTEFEGE